MSRENQERTSRRSFLRGLGAATLGALAWTTLRRRSPDGINRTPRSRCERCRVLSACSRPDALQARDALGIETDAARPARIDDAERLCLGDDAIDPSSDAGS